MLISDCGGDLQLPQSNSDKSHHLSAAQVQTSTPPGHPWSSLNVMDADVGLQEEDMEGSWTLLSWLASCLMVFGGALPYIPQYQEIQRSNNTEGFSTRVCLVLLIANILRIFFWWGCRRGESVKIIQSTLLLSSFYALLKAQAIYKVSEVNGIGVKARIKMRWYNQSHMLVAFKMVLHIREHRSLFQLEGRERKCNHFFIASGWNIVLFIRSFL